MARHIVDHAHQVQPEAPLMRYARAARRLSDDPTDPRLVALRRRVKGPFDPGARLRAFLRIERGRRA